MTTRIFSLLVFVLVSTQVFAQKTLFVKANGTGDGKSWNTAAGNLQAILAKAAKGDQIWVAQGTYLPTEGTNRIAAFEIPNGVQLIGGFAGTEQTIAQRNTISNHPSILSGNIGSQDAEDNCYNVVIIKYADPSTVLDGFTITGGYCNGDYGIGTNQRRSGGGLYNEGWKGRKSNPTIKNCIFTENFAKDGGAVYNNGKSGEASPTFTNCTFQANSSDLDGGAIFNDGRVGGKSNPTFTNCRFVGNKGNYGGAICNYGAEGMALPTYTECVFNENNAYVRGGAIMNITNQEIKNAAYATVTFSNNTALDHDSDNVHHLLVSEQQVASK